MALKVFSTKWVDSFKKVTSRFTGDNNAADSGNMPDGSQQGYNTSRHMFGDSMRMRQVPQQPMGAQQPQQGPAPYGNQTGQFANDPVSQYTGSVTGFGSNSRPAFNYDPMAGQTAPPPPQNTGYQQPVGQNTGYQPMGQNTSYQQPVSQNTGYQPMGQNTSYQQPVSQNTGYQPMGQNTSYQQPVGQNTGYQPMGQNTSYQQPVGQNTSYQPNGQNNSYQQPLQHRKRKGQGGNVVPLNPDNGFTAPDGTNYTHVERVVQLMSVSKCFRVIEFMRGDESVIVNTEGIASEADIQRCLDMLAGAAFTLQATMTKISQQKHVYLIAPRKVLVMADSQFDAWADNSEARQRQEAPRRDPYRPAPNAYHQQQRASGQASAIYGANFDQFGGQRY